MDDGASGPRLFIQRDAICGVRIPAYVYGWLLSLYIRVYVSRGAYVAGCAVYCVVYMYMGPPHAHVKAGTHQQSPRSMYIPRFYRQVAGSYGMHDLNNYRSVLKGRNCSLAF